MIIENIKRTRSHRKFSEKEIKSNEILQIIEGARFTASAKNSQILRYSYTTDQEKCKKLFSSISLGGLLKLEDKPIFEERPKAYILIAIEKNTTISESMLYFDIGMASQNILLIANDLGYASCVVMSYNKKELEETLELPNNYDSKALIVLGEAKDDVILINAKNTKNTRYYIENKKHYVPKLTLEQILLNK